jgi:hypothetical protein
MSIRFDRGGERDARTATGTVWIGYAVAFCAPALTLSLLLTHEPRPSALVRRYAILFAIVLLCTASYFAGIWTGFGFHQTRCITESPGVLVCGTGVTQPPSGNTPDVVDPRVGF